MAGKRAQCRNQTVPLHGHLAENALQKAAEYLAGSVGDAGGHVGDAGDPQYPHAQLFEHADREAIRATLFGKGYDRYLLLLEFPYNTRARSHPRA